MATVAEIERLAYELWERDGRQHGRDKEYYYAAERMLAERESHDSNVAAAEAPKPRRTRASASSAKPRTTRTKKTTE